MKVLKFGGSSQGSNEAIEQVVKVVKERTEQGELGVVVSAFQGVTDQLIELSKLAKNGELGYEEKLKVIHDRHIKTVQDLVDPKHQTPIISNVKQLLNELEDALRGIYLIRECSDRSMDLVMSFGERLSATIISGLLNSREVEAFYLDAREVIETDSTHGNAKVDVAKSAEKIKEYIQGKNGIPVMTGFIARSPEGVTTTIGRSGSDYTASILGVGLGVEEIQIWTDVDGVMSADPRRVKDAFSIENMSYEEAMELSHFGAKVIHPSTMTPAVKAEIPIIIKNTFNPEHPGTIISKKPNGGKVIVGISSIDEVVFMNLSGSGLVGMPGISERLFGALAREKISVILITQASSEHSICFSLYEIDKARAEKAIEDEFKLEIQLGYVNPLKCQEEVSILAVVGSNMPGRSGTAGTLFQALGENNVNIIAIAQGSSELNISFLVNRKDSRRALNTIHQAFFLSKVKTVHIFCVGVGTVGGEFMRQLECHGGELEESLGLRLQLTGVANSRKMLFDGDGISLDGYKEKLEEAGEEMSIDAFFEKMKSCGKSFSIFVDCTANDVVPSIYEKCIENHIPVVTPNKKANSKPYADYLNMRQLMRKYGTGFYYETNVGAGLPIIETLKDLKQSGDRVEGIEGILSGTLSYIFNNFDGSQPFSAVVKQAQDNGYTEPDPRDDLSGTDVARKLLILARQIGLKLEMEDISVENLVPESCRGKGSVEDFYNQLKAEDGAFTQKFEAAKAEGNVLRYVGQIKEGKASVELVAVSNAHPFASLKGSDNIVSFNTRRYNQTPLVIQGPGAGPAVTAAGVFADIIRAAQSFSSIRERRALMNHPNSPNHRSLKEDKEKKGEELKVTNP